MTDDLKEEIVKHADQLPISSHLKHHSFCCVDVNFMTMLINPKYVYIQPSLTLAPKMLSISLVMMYGLQNILHLHAHDVHACVLDCVK